MPDRPPPLDRFTDACEAVLGRAAWFLALLAGGLSAAWGLDAAGFPALAHALAWAALAAGLGPLALAGLGLCIATFLPALAILAVLVLALAVELWRQARRGDDEGGRP